MVAMNDGFDPDLYHIPKVPKAPKVSAVPERESVAAVWSRVFLIITVIAAFVVLFAYPAKGSGEFGQDRLDQSYWIPAIMLSMLTGPFVLIFIGGAIALKPSIYSISIGIIAILIFAYPLILTYIS